MRPLPKEECESDMFKSIRPKLEAFRILQEARHGPNKPFRTPGPTYYNPKPPPQKIIGAQFCKQTGRDGRSLLFFTPGPADYETEKYKQIQPILATHNVKVKAQVWRKIKRASRTRRNKGNIEKQLPKDSILSAKGPSHQSEINLLVESILAEIMKNVIEYKTSKT